MEPLRIDDWSGGITDHYVNGPLNRSQKLDNFLIDRNRKPVVRPGSSIYNSTYYQIPAGNQRIGKIHYSQSILFQQSARNLYYVNASWVTLIGPVAGNPAFGAGTVANQMSVAEWNKHLLLTIDEYSLPRMVYDGTGSNGWRVRNLGLPALASSPSVALTAGATALSYLYAFVHKYEYTVGTVTYIQRGPPIYVQVTANGTAIAGGSPSTITVIPALGNGTTECYDTTNIKVEIYRTVDGGVDLKYVKEVANGTASTTDGVADGSLGVAIYTAGDVVDNDPPPQAKYVICADGVAWFLNVKEGSAERPFRARQALKDQPGACPEDFYVDVDGDITGGGVVDVYPIVFSKNKIWRFEGYVDNQGRGFTRKRVVSSSVGCISHNSIVAVLGGLYFAGRDGFYFTDGFRVQKLSGHLNESYKAATSTATQKKRIHGALDPVDGRIYWTMTSTSDVTDCDTIWILDPYWGMSVESCFTTWSSDVDMAPTSLAFQDTLLVRSDKRGYCFKHSDSYYTDLVVDTSKAPSLWVTKAVVYDYISSAYSFGTEVRKKYVTKLTMTASNETNLSLLIQSINDDSGVGYDLKELKFRNGFLWGDADIVWGDASIIWNYSGTIIAERMFPKGTLHCVYKQVRMTNVTTNIMRSDDYGLATIDPVGKTALLVDAATKDWPTGIEGYSLTLENDGYDTDFQITTRTADTITVVDATGELPAAGDYKWLVRGKRKNERLILQSYSLDWQLFGDFTRGYDNSTSGENA